LLYQAAGYAAGLAQTLWRRPLPMSPEDVRQMRQPAWICDHEAITRELGWRPKIGIEQGFRQMHRWYRDQGWL
jgi:nucleoside-diphosphate-sugar epimerase